MADEPSFGEKFWNTAKTIPVTGIPITIGEQVAGFFGIGGKEEPDAEERQEPEPSTFEQLVNELQQIERALIVGSNLYGTIGRVFTRTEPVSSIDQQELSAVVDQLRGGFVEEAGQTSEIPSVIEQSRSDGRGLG